MRGQYQAPAALPQERPDTLCTEGLARLGAAIDGTETQRNERNGTLSAAQTHIGHGLVNSLTRRCETKSALQYYTELPVDWHFRGHDFISQPVDRLSRLRLSWFSSVIQENSGVCTSTSDNNGSLPWNLQFLLTIINSHHSTIYISSPR
jgi:hypothetical protein